MDPVLAPLGKKLERLQSPKRPGVIFFLVRNHASRGQSAICTHLHTTMVQPSTWPLCDMLLPNPGALGKEVLFRLCYF